MRTEEVKEKRREADTAGAFLIPYMTCSICFGLPCLYLEFAIGQFTQRGPIKAFHYFMPAMQGVGWAMAVVSATVSIYYNVIVAWSAMYIAKIVVGDSHQWASCRNPWNTECPSPFPLSDSQIASHGWRIGSVLPPTRLVPSSPI